MLHRRETGGTTVSTPETRGLASLSAKQGFAYELSGVKDIMFATQRRARDPAGADKAGLGIRPAFGEWRPMMNTLQGKRVMVVEDELLVAMMIEDILIEQDCIVLGPYTNLADALKASATEQMDLAVLDVNLRGEKIYPVAKMLSDRGVPFLLLSGYGADAIPPDQPHWRACAKPFSPEELTSKLCEQIEARAQLPG